MTTTDHRVRVQSPTEGRNPRTLRIDAVPTIQLLELLNDEDALVAGAVRKALPQLATLVDAAVERYAAGGSIHYFGAGTSGRIGMLDAAELPPTFSADPARTVAHHAGGAVAVDRARELTEDDLELGREAAADVTARDVAIGLAASGRTPYVAAALAVAREAGAYTALISSAPDAEIAPAVDVHVCTDTGPEAIAGSTRLKAGTAHKMVLNSFSTALMIRLGRTYSNLMVEVRPTNAKLRGRVLRIIEEATGVDEAASADALEAADGDTRTAIVSLLADVDPTSARLALDRSGGRVRGALEVLGVTSPSAAPTRDDEVPMQD
jgi:N-acetylmuramic acid 6-phosphate etherase